MDDKQFFILYKLLVTDEENQKSHYSRLYITRNKPYEEVYQDFFEITRNEQSLSELGSGKLIVEKSMEVIIRQLDLERVKGDTDKFNKLRCYKLSTGGNSERLYLSSNPMEALESYTDWMLNGPGSETRSKKTDNHQFQFSEFDLNPIANYRQFVKRLGDKK